MITELIEEISNELGKELVRRINELAEDFDNSDSRRLLIQEFGNIKFPISGRNDSGEKILLNVSKNGIVVDTFQSNGWVRLNFYDADGNPEGESFDGRWR